jgi:hypothetical protein
MADRASALVVAACCLVGAACGTPTGGAALLKESVESIGNEMIALHEPRRGVEYHVRSGTPFWVAFIPPQADQDGLAAAGLGSTELARCRQSGLTAVAVGGPDRTDCATLPRLSINELRVLRKSAGDPVRMTLALDAKGYRLVQVE